MVVGPVAVQGNIPRPPFSNEVENVPQKLKSQTVPNKQLPIFPNYGDFPTPSTVSRSLKYPELYTVTTKSSKYSDPCFPTGEYDMPLFPVDTPNIIPDSNTSSVNFKQAQPPLPDSQIKSSNGSELSYLFPDSEDFDLSSLLSIPLPQHNDTDTRCYNNLGDANNMMMSMDLFGGPQPNLFELDLMDHIQISMESDIPDDIHYSHGLQKGCSKESQATIDPFMSTLYNLPLSEECSPAQSSILDDTASMSNGSPTTSTSFDNVRHFDESSSVDMLSPPPREDLALPPPHTPATTTSDKSLNIFDISDLTGRYMFPPPKKRQENFPSNNQYWLIDKKPQVVPHLSPKKEHSLPPPPPPPISTVEAMVEGHGIQPKLEHNDTNDDISKPTTLLFGKHEGEIIHKLLPKNTSRAKPITRDKLITIPVEEFNQLLEQADLTEIEVAFMKEWRRRGKNKAAAQVARKRKREEVSELDEEVQLMRQQKVELQKKCDLLRSRTESFKGRCLAAEDELFHKQSLNSKEPITRDTHLIHVSDNKLFLIPHVGSKILIVNEPF